MKYEVSAGAVIVRKNTRSREVLLIRDMNGNWTFPKGIIEKGEKSREAAIREAFEEVGIENLQFLSKLTPTNYIYNRGGLIKKTVQYFLFASRGREKLLPQKEEGITEAKWVSLSAASRITGYPKTNVPLLRETRKFFLQKESPKKL